MLPTIDELSNEFGFAVFLAELRDFRTLVKSFRFLFKQGPAALLRLQGLRAFSSFSKKATISNLLKDLGKVSAEARLTAEFAFKPLVADLTNMLSIGKKLNKFLKDWNRDASRRKLRVRHYCLNSWLDEQCIGQLAPLTVPDYYISDSHGSTSITPVHSASGYAHLGFIPLTVEYKGLREAMAYFDLLGLGDGISLVWNVIPFSFLVDYVLTVDKALDQFSKNMTQLPVMPAYFGYSLKRNLSYHSYSSNPGTTAIGRGVITYKDYQRVRMHPSAIMPWDGSLRPDTLELKLPSVNQWKNLLALITVLVRGR
jgi:hypothetical protein